MTKSNKDISQGICEMVTQKLLTLIEQGVTPWVRPWEASGYDEAISHTTGKPYSLLNQILLEFRSGEYLTFNQVKKEGGSVKKGAKTQIVVFWQCGRYMPVKIEDEEDSQDEDEKKEVWVSYHTPVLKYYRVFHINDCVGIKPRYAKEKDVVITYTNDPIEAAENVANDYCSRSGVTLRVCDSNKAYYQPFTDSVTVPKLSQFKETAEYYSTLFHELTHSTGHKSRLNRLGNGTGIIVGLKEEYSREELVAEIGAAACLSRLGIENKKTTENSAAYLENWASFLKNDKKAFIVAAGRAEKAVELIFNSQTK